MSCRKENIMTRYLIIFSFCLLFTFSGAEDDQSKEETEEEIKEKWKKKNIRDYSDADVERLYDQWEEDEEPVDEDELPEWKRPHPKVDLSELDPSQPEKLLEKSKKGRTLMMFATVAGNPTEKETEQISSLWHSSLFNAQFEIQRFVVGSNRVLFMMQDGAKAWEIKDYLVSLENCLEVTVEGKSYVGRAAHMEQQRRAEMNMKKTQQQDGDEGEEIKADDEDEDENKASKKKPKTEL